MRRRSRRSSIICDANRGVVAAELTSAFRDYAVAPRCKADLYFQSGESQQIGTKLKSLRASRGAIVGKWSDGLRLIRGLLLRLKRDFEIEIIFSRRGVFDSGQIKFRTGDALRLEIKKSVRGFAGREHLGRKCANLDFRGIQRAAFGLVRERIGVRRGVRHARFFYVGVDVQNVGRGCRLDM